MEEKYKKLKKYLKEKDYFYWNFEEKILSFVISPIGEKNKLLKSYIKRLFGDNTFYNYSSKEKIQKIYYNGLILIYKNY